MECWLEIEHMFSTHFLCSWWQVHVKLTEIQAPLMECIMVFYQKKSCIFYFNLKSLLQALLQLKSIGSNWCKQSYTICLLLTSPRNFFYFFLSLWYSIIWSEYYHLTRLILHCQTWFFSFDFKKSVDLNRVIVFEIIIKRSEYLFRSNQTLYTLE